MAKYIKTEGLYRIYELSEAECKQHSREFPTFVCWYNSHNDDMGNMRHTENESETIEEMAKWCREYSIQIFWRE